MSPLSINNFMELSTYSLGTIQPASPQQIYNLGLNFNNLEGIKRPKTQRLSTLLASKSGNFSLNSILKKCEKCAGQGAVECPGCKGTGRNKKNGNIFERWKCFDCQGFGLKSCPVCGKGGLTPEQRGER